MTNMVIVKGSETFNIQYSWYERDIVSCQLKVLKPDSYSPVTNDEDDPISAAFRKSQKIPLLSIISYNEYISIPAEKLNLLMPGIYDIRFIITYPLQSMDFTAIFVEAGTLQIVEDIK